MFFCYSGFSQEKQTISGFVTDSRTGEALIGATIYDMESKQGTITNTYGFFSLAFQKGKHCIEYRFIGYAHLINCFYLDNDTIITLKLEPNLFIKDIVVKGNKVSDANRELSGLSRHRLNMAMLNRMPVIAGERDILKSLQYLPGVKSGKENAASFNVRGGSNDQNLILLDGVPVYNVTHLMGFFSVFNNDAIKNVDLYKGGIPARYGGRLSSVLDIRMKEGNLIDDGGVFSISPVSARISYEAPIKIDTGAFIASYRRSFMDLPMRIFNKLSGVNGDEGYFFHDFNGKINWKFSNNSRVYFSIYSGKDKLFFVSKDEEGKSKGSYNWGNLTTVLRWNKVLTKNIFANFSAYYSRFKHFQSSGRKTDEQNSLFTTESKLEDISLKSDFDFFVASNYLMKFGFNYSKLRFSPYIIQIRNVEQDIAANPTEHSNSDFAAIYLENAFQTGRFDFNIGARVSGYNSNKKNYLYFQPRASVKYFATNLFSVSATYTQMVQVMHLLTNSSLGMPTDLWVASTDKTKPQTARQVSLGFSTNRIKNYNFEIEGYYKWMEDVIRFKEGVSFLSSDSYNWEELIIAGKGRAYGVEFMAEKKSGKVTGIASYTLAWSERQFDELNSGKWFPFKYDRRHDFSILAEYSFPEKYMRQKSISIGFTLQSGNNLSIPDTEIKGVVPDGFAGGYDSHYWEQRQTFNNPNNFKMPVFHHLDIGYTIKQKKTNTKSITWNFSIYNVYNRMNPWFYYREEGKVKQYSLFPIMPSIGFTYKW